MFLLSLSLSQIIIPPCSIVFLGSKDHGIPKWYARREPRGMRCGFCPSQNSPKPWGSGGAMLSPISSPGSPSPHWACAWSLSQLLHPVPFITWGMHTTNILLSVCHLQQQVLANMKSPTVHTTREVVPSFPWSAPEPRGQRHHWPMVQA